ncbi:MAG: ABC transporter substrate-binding protein [Deltaproteobacteria bacterium]|nr:ABC transporter substrate-binding protein [Deltaproteobacteria bacterium]
MVSVSGIAKWLLIAVALFGVLASGADPAPCFAGNEIVLGAATTMGLAEGEESVRAANLAVAEINARGGIRVGNEHRSMMVETVDLRDALPGVPVRDALSVLENMVRIKKPHAVVVGPFRSEVLLPSMEIMANHRVPLLGTIAMTPASEVKVMRDSRYRYVFRVGLNSRYLVAYLIDAMKLLGDRFGFKRVFVMNQDVAWARTTASLMVKLFFERAGWEVLGIETCASGMDDFSAPLQKAGTKAAQVILPIFDMPQSGILVKQWKAMRVPAVMAGFISPLAGPGAWNAFEGKIGGAINCNFELGSAIASGKVPRSMAFYEAYERRYGRPMEAGHGPAPAYESVYVLAEAMERANSLEPEELVKALEETDREGVIGRIRFHKGHQVVFGKNPEGEALACLFQWTDGGKRRIVYPPSIAEGEIELPASFRR